MVHLLLFRGWCTNRSSNFCREPTKVHHGGVKSWRIERYIFQNAIQEASNHIHIDSVCSAEGLWSKGTPTLSWRGYTIEIGHFFDEKLVKSNFWPNRWSCGIWTSVIQFVRTHNTRLLSLVWGHNSSGTCRGELFSKYRYFHTSLFRYRRTH